MLEAQNSPLYEWADKQQACIDGLDWVAGKSLAEAWASNDRPDNIIWLIGRAKLADKEQRATLFLLAEKCSLECLGCTIWEQIEVEANEGQHGRMWRVYMVAVGLVKAPHCTDEQRQRFCHEVRRVVAEPSEFMLCNVAR